MASIWKVSLETPEGVTLLFATCKTEKSAVKMLDLAREEWKDHRTTETYPVKVEVD